MIKVHASPTRGSGVTRRRPPRRTNLPITSRIRASVQDVKENVPMNGKSVSTTVMGTTISLTYGAIKATKETAKAVPTAVITIITTAMITITMIVPRPVPPLEAVLP